MSSPTVGDHVVSRLGLWGAHRFYGYPGDGIGGVVSAIGRAVEAGDAEFVQVRHEETAGFAATADVKYGGSPLGVAVVTSGPGAVHVLNGLYDAKLDHVPVVALVGQTASNALGTSYYQELDLVRLYSDVAGEFVFQVTRPDQVQHVVDRAARTALERRTVTAVVLPSDVQDADAVVEVPQGHGYTHTSAVPGSLPGTPRTEALAQAAKVLRSGRKVAILAGAGALSATEELTAVADRLGAGVAKALLGKTVLDDRLDWVTGAIGLLGTRPSYDLMRQCDVLLMVGTTMPYSEYYPARDRPAPCRSTSTAPAAGCATPPRSTSSGTREKPSPPCCRCWRGPTPTRRGARTSRGGTTPGTRGVPNGRRPRRTP